MCRMLAFMSREPKPISHYVWEVSRSLQWMSHSGRKAPHRDGFGIAHKNDEGRMILRTWGQEELAPLEARQFADIAGIKTTLLLAHARQASEGYQEMTSAEAHPFLEDTLYLAHNGTIRDVHALGGSEGTDTQRLLRWMIAHWKPRSFLGLRAALMQLLGAIKDYTAIDLLITEGTHIYAFCCFREQPEYYTMHFRVDETLVIVASEPLDDGAWQQLRSGELLQISPDLTVQQDRVV